MTAIAQILTARKSVTAAAAALAIGLGLAASATPAAAWTHHHHRGYGWGAPVAAGVIGGLALGAMAASSAPAYSECWMERRRIYNDRGRFVGFRRIRVCD